MVVNVSHDEYVALPFKSHPVFIVNISLENTGMSLYRMAAKTGVPEIGVEEFNGFIDFPSSYVR